MAKKRNIKDAAPIELDDTPYSGEGIEIEGNYPDLERVKTGLYSLDVAASKGGDLGVPLRVILEFYGYTNSGKSTLSYFILGKIAQYLQERYGSGRLGIADLEMLDKKYIHYAIGMSGHKGHVRLMDMRDEKKRPSTHEKILMDMAKYLYQEDVGAVLWDSAGATKSMVELKNVTDPKGEFGEAHMGKDAKLVTQVVSALRTVLISKETPCSAVVVNHVHGIMGGRGHTTKGGERLKFLAGLRAMIWSSENFYKGEDEKIPLGFLVRGQMEKLRFGGKGREFQFYIVPGFGVHEGVSAMFDCLELGLAEKDGQGRVKLDGKSLGYIKSDLLTYAAEGKFRKFYPFIDLIQKQYEKVEHGED